MSSAPGSTIDLHTHSTASDGTLDPAAVVRLAADQGVTAFALTDHDTVAGLPAAQAACAALDIDFLPGIEVTAAFPRPGTLHLLGYGFDPDHPAFRRLTTQLATAREDRITLILHRLRHHANIDLSMDQVLAETQPPIHPSSLHPHPLVTRPHLARLLVKLGHAATTRDAFDRFLGSSGIAYVDTAPLDAPAVISAIRAAGGLVSLAHPLQLRRATFAQLAALIRELADQGLEALEVMHSTHDLDTVHKLTRLADREDLLTTGGSDYHGPHRSTLPGRAAGRAIPRAFYDALRARLHTRRPHDSASTPVAA
jgi:predicted metal-dependent phosphoesterase TrpH